MTMSERDLDGVRSELVDDSQIYKEVAMTPRTTFRLIAAALIAVPMMDTNHVNATDLDAAIVLQNTAVERIRSKPVNIHRRQRDHERAEARNVTAKNSLVRERMPGFVVMRSIGSVRRRKACLAVADCKRQAITTGNYLHASKRAPWIVFMTHVGPVNRSGKAHDAGETTAHNVVDIPQRAIRPGGITIRSFGSGMVIQRLE